MKFAQGEMKLYRVVEHDAISGLRCVSVGMEDYLGHGRYRSYCPACGRPDMWVAVEEIEETERQLLRRQLELEQNDVG